jgi:hypothetical protein
VIKSTRAPTRKIEGIEKKIVANCVGQNHHGRFPATCYRGPWLRLQVTDALRRVAICQHSLAAVHFFYTLSCLVIFLIFLERVRRGPAAHAPVSFVSHRRRRRWVARAGTRCSRSRFLCLQLQVVTSLETASVHRFITQDAAASTRC